MAAKHGVLPQYEPSRPEKRPISGVGVEGISAPDGYHDGTRPRLALLVASGSVFWVSYLATALPTTITATINAMFCVTGSCRQLQPELGYIPIIGPLLMTRPNVGHLSVGLAIAGTAFQTAGVLGMAASFLFPEKIWVRNPQGQVLSSVRLTPSGVAGEF